MCIPQICNDNGSRYASGLICYAVTHTLIKIASVALTNGKCPERSSWAFADAFCLDPSYLTYPNPLSPTQISAGLAAPAAAVAIAGKGGAVALLITLFMACTSCLSAELIATSSVLTFDVYKTYWRPKATQPELITVAHAMICVSAVVTAAFACLWQGVGIGMLFFRFWVQTD